VGGLEETSEGLRKQFSPSTPTFVIISDYKEEEQVGRKATKNLKKKLVDLLKLSNWQTFHLYQLKENSLI
jgi:3-deoxy-D-manno-octulosonic-acid transferase